MSLFGRDEDRSEPEQRPAIVMQRQPQPVQHPPLVNAAAWLRNLRYEDMMQLATEMHGMRQGDAIDTPEQLAKLVHSWAKSTTDAEL